MRYSYLTLRFALPFLITVSFTAAIGLVDMKRDSRLIIESSTYEMYQVFYDTGPDGFNAPDSARSGELIKGPTPGRNFYSIAFPVPDKPINNIRIDPGMEAGKILFRSIRLEAGFLTFHEWQARDIVRDFKPLNDIGEFSEKEGVLTIESKGGDPYFLLPEDQTRMIFGKARSRLKILTWVIKFLLILFVGFLVFYFSSGMEILFRTFFDIVFFVIGRVIFYLKSLITLGITGGHGFHQVVFVVLFLVLLALPAVNAQLRFLPQTESTEKRNLAPRPVLDMKRLSSFPGEYEKYFNDHFGLRNDLVRWHSLLQFKWMKISSMPEVVVIGKDGWMFNASDSMMRDYRGLLSYSREDLIKIKDHIAKEKAFMDSMGIVYLIVLCPNKDTIYPEFVPDTMTRVRNSRRLDQLADYLKENKEIPLMDLRNAFQQAKKSYPLYYKLDTHWNAFAGFVAYQEIMKELVKVFPGLSPLGMADFEMSTEIVDKADGDLVSPLVMGGVLPEVRVHLNPKIKIPASKKIRKALVFHDSFIHALSPYLGHDFETVILRHHQERPVDLKLIENEKPDVVIFQVAERFQHALMNHSSQ
jgi:hypothetical protein